MNTAISSVDLTNCDKELIHLPGRIQSHGFFLTIDNNYTIKCYSDNIKQFLPGEDGQIIGQHISWIESFLKAPYVNGTITKTLDAGRLNQNFEHTNPLVLTFRQQAYYLIVYDAGDKCLLEFEPALTAAADDIQAIMGRSITLILANGTLQELLNNAAEEVKSIIGYDRVMIYKFAADGHGEVVAEAANSDLEPFLGLHYPASDIPQQARALYKLNHTRLIADVNDPTAALLSTEGATPSLDLTHSQLRAVSPIHIQYLKNMGVASSYSISLLYNGELWGLIACHNYTAKFIDFKLRKSSKLIGQLLSSALSFRQEEENKLLQQELSINMELLSKQLQQHDRIPVALTEGQVNIANLLHSDGAALFYEGQVFTVGLTPAREELRELQAWLRSGNGEAIYANDFLSKVFTPAAGYKHVASGILYLPLSKELDECVIWFKKEQLQFVKWAGDPNKPVEIKDGLAHISPRNSFREWQQEVTGQSTPWASEEIKVADRLKDEILYAVNAKARALRQLNEKLQLAYEELDTFSYTISHDLKNPLTVIKSFTQLLGTFDNMPKQATPLLARIEDRTNKMNFMIGAILDYSKIGRNAIVHEPVDMKTMIAEIVADHDLTQDKNLLEVHVGDTPVIYGDPLMISQVFSNLIGNAIKYSTHNKKGIVHISGKKEERGICYEISDNGIGMEDTSKAFDLFHRMENVKDIEGTGVGLAIVKRIVDKHQGTITITSKLQEGTVFNVCFPVASH